MRALGFVILMAVILCACGEETVIHRERARWISMERHPERMCPSDEQVCDNRNA